VVIAAVTHHWSCISASVSAEEHRTHSGVIDKSRSMQAPRLLRSRTLKDTESRELYMLLAIARVAYKSINVA
jgi:hypothetical protein